MCRIKVFECLKLCSSASNNLATAQQQNDDSPTGTVGRFVCSQLKALALAVISEVYDTTANEHGAKMLAAAYPIAKKMKAETLCLIVGRLQEGIIETVVLNSYWCMNPNDFVIL